MNRLWVTFALLGASSCGSGSGAAPGAAGDDEPARADAPPLRARPLAPELQAAVKAVKEQRYEPAQELARRYVDAHPEDGQAAYLLGMTYHWAGNFGAARPWLEKALALEPETYIIHDSLGHCLFMLGELGGARREYEAYLAAVPEEPKAHYGLGLIELEETRLDEAARRFRRAIEIFEGLERRAPEQAAARLPELAECHARLGEVHFARAEYEAARTELARATTLCPGNISAFYTLSLVHRRLGEDELADEAAGKYESARRALVGGEMSRSE